MSGGLPHIPSPFPLHLGAGLTQLRQAFDYAVDSGRDLWEFAVEISDLRAAGMTTSDVRWLVSKGYVQHGQEISRCDTPHRSFRPGVGLTFSKSSSFVLTRDGAALLAPSTTAAAPSDANVALPPIIVHRIALALKPTWNARNRELRVSGFMVKKFRVPAGNQELILAAFQEESWPAYIDDPLPANSETTPKRRLHNVINRLNGGQLMPILRFHGNGTGDGVGWQLLSSHLLPAAKGAASSLAVATSPAPSAEVDSNRSQIETRVAPVRVVTNKSR
jgi:hypothetical protein